MRMRLKKQNFWRPLPSSELSTGRGKPLVDNASHGKCSFPAPVQFFPAAPPPHILPCLLGARPPATVAAAGCAPITRARSETEGHLIYEEGRANGKRGGHVLLSAIVRTSNRGVLLWCSALVRPPGSRRRGWQPGLPFFRGACRSHVPRQYLSSSPCPLLVRQGHVGKLAVPGCWQACRVCPLAARRRAGGGGGCRSGAARVLLHLRGGQIGG